MEHIAHQYATEQIRCNYLTLGWTPTEGEVALRNSQGESEAELRKRAADILPMGRMCERNDYMEAWNFENWGIRYWSRTPEFLAYVNGQEAKEVKR